MSLGRASLRSDLRMHGTRRKDLRFARGCIIVIINIIIIIVVIIR